MPINLDQGKRGLQDDHDPNDIGQKANEATGDFTAPKQPAGSYNRGRESGESTVVGSFDTRR
jgi:hypothetical protein